MKFKKVWSILLSSALAAAVLTGCGNTETAPESTADNSGLVVKIGTQEMPNDEGIAKALGYFEEEMGAEIELVKFDSGKDVNTALTSGSIDFGLLGSCPATIGICNDIGVELIWIHEVLGSVESLVAKSETGIETAEGLKGKKVAVPFASTAHFSVLKALDNAGLSSTDVELLDMSPDKIYAAWQTGEIDAAYIWEPTLSMLENKTTVLTSADMAEIGAMTSNVEVVNKKFAEEHPDIVEGYIRAVDKAVKLFKENPDEAIKAISDSIGLTPEDAKAQMSGSIWLTAEEQKGEDYFGGALKDNLIDTAAFLVDQKSIPSLPDSSVIEAGINGSFLDAVK